MNTLLLGIGPVWVLFRIDHGDPAPAASRVAPPRPLGRATPGRAPGRAV